jgi:hypothetical protein
MHFTLPRQFPMNRLITLLSLLVVCGVFIRTLMAYPLPGCDEATYGGTAVSLLQEGRVAMRTWGIGEPTGRDVNALVFGRIYSAGLALTMEALGRSLFAARLFSLAGWLCATLTLYHLTRRFFTSMPAAPLSALLFAVSTKSFLIAHFVRPEGWLSAAVLVVLGILLYTNDHPRLAFAGGIGAALLIDFHLNGLFFSLGLGLAFLSTCIIERCRWRRLALFVAGWVLGLILVVGVRVPTGGVTSAQMVQVPFIGRYFVEDAAPRQTEEPQPQTDSSIPDMRSPGLIEDRWYSAGSFLAVSFGSSGGPIAFTEALFAVIGTVYALTHHNRTARLVLVTYAVALLLFLLISPPGWFQYGALWSPAYYLLGIVGLLHFMRRYSRSLIFGLAGLAALNLAGDIWLAGRTSEHHYEALANKIAQSLQPDDVIMGDIVWWWGLEHPDHLITDQHLDYAARQGSRISRAFYGVSRGDGDQEITGRVFSMIAPDVVLIDGALGCADSSTPIHKAFISSVEQTCTQIGIVEPAITEWPASPIGQATRIFRCP